MLKPHNSLYFQHSLREKVMHFQILNMYEKETLMSIIMYLITTQM